MQVRRAGKQRRYSLALRLRVLKLLFRRSRKFSFTRRLISLSRRYGIPARTFWRWVARHRAGGPNALRDLLRSDTLTRRAPNVVSIDPDTPVRLPLDTAEQKP